LSGQHFVSGGQALGRATAKNSAPATVWARRIAMMAAGILFATPDTASAQSFWNWGPADYYDQRPVKQKRVKVKRKADPAEAAAKNSSKPVGPLVIAVSVEKQRVKVYDSNGLFAEAPVSTGTKSHPTPYGVFSIIQKNRHHVSNLYGAAMPYMQRITWSGVAMHTGPLPGYAASHGCIRLPNDFAARLWTWTKMGTRVIVAPGEVSPRDVTHTKLVSKMVPLPSVSAAPAPAQVAAEVATPRQISAQQRTADARDAIAGMKGTLTDVGHGAIETKVSEAARDVARPAQIAPVETKAVEPQAVEAKPVETRVVEATPPDIATALKQLSLTVANEVLARAKPESKPIETNKAAQTAAKVDELAVKPEDRNNSDESASDNVAETPAPTDKQAEPKSAEAPPAVAKPAEPAQNIAKPAETTTPGEIAKPADIAKATDIVKPAEAAKPADAAAPTATEPAKPVVTAAPRRHNHVAVFISRKDKKLYIRHGYEPVYDTPVEIAEADRPLGTHVFTARGDKDDTNALRWSVVSLPQVARKSEARRITRQGTKATPAPVQSNVIPALNASEALDRITIPAEALEKIAAIIAPGGSLLISDHGLTGWETGKGTDFIVPLR
jgi:lipoprotein-anchoring transpeptidase ErfK/SrfK